MPGPVLWEAVFAMLWNLICEHNCGFELKCQINLSLPIYGSDEIQFFCLWKSYADVGPGGGFNMLQVSSTSIFFHPLSFEPNCSCSLLDFAWQVASLKTAVRLSVDDWTGLAGLCPSWAGRDWSPLFPTCLSPSGQRSGLLIKNHLLAVLWPHSFIPLATDIFGARSGVLGGACHFLLTLPRQRNDCVCSHPPSKNWFCRPLLRSISVGLLLPIIRNLLVGLDSIQGNWLQHCALCSPYISACELTYVQANPAWA